MNTKAQILEIRNPIILIAVAEVLLIIFEGRVPRRRHEIPRYLASTACLNCIKALYFVEQANFRPQITNLPNACSGGELTCCD